MEFVATMLRDFGFALYAGPMVMWAILMCTSGRLHDLSPVTIGRIFRSWGPGFGLSMGALVSGALVLRWMETNTFAWTVDTPIGALDSFAWSTLFLLWVSNIKLEIWTLDPIRKLDDGHQISDEEAYRSASSKLTRHLAIHALLLAALAGSSIFLRISHAI